MKIVLIDIMFIILSLITILTLTLYVTVRTVTDDKILIKYDSIKSRDQKKIYKNISIAQKKKKKQENSKIKYILQWTSPYNEPFVFMGKGQQGFIDRKCAYTNCFVTSDRNHLNGDYTKFDVIIFHGPEVIYIHKDDLPQKRSPQQKFVFASQESADNYPLCSSKLNGFFNWTWTYKLNSDVVWGNIVVKDSYRNVIGPKINMRWIKSNDMDPVSDDLIKVFNGKTKAVAWFSSNCRTRSKREDVVNELKMELEDKYNRTVDVFGRCGSHICSRKNETECNYMLEKYYYFYLALENSISPDYVTEKILRPLNFNTIPIILGGANYTRFLPKMSYINAKYYGAHLLAAKIDKLINNIDKYYEYFKWKKYYSFHNNGESAETNDYCKFCALLNDEKRVKQRTVYENFRKWWDRPHRC